MAKIMKSKKLSLIINVAILVAVVAVAVVAGTLAWFYRDASSDSPLEVDTATFITLLFQPSKDPVEGELTPRVLAPDVIQKNRLIHGYDWNHAGYVTYIDAYSYVITPVASGGIYVKDGGIASFTGTAQNFTGNTVDGSTKIYFYAKAFPNGDKDDYDMVEAGEIEVWADIVYTLDGVEGLTATMRNNMGATGFSLDVDNDTEIAVIIYAKLCVPDMFFDIDAEKIGIAFYGRRG